MKLSCVLANPVFINKNVDIYYLQIMKFHLAECKFIICKTMDTPARQNSGSTSPVMAEQDLTRSLSEAVSRAISETVSAVIAQARVVQKVDNAIHRINHYPLELVSL